MVIRKWRQVRFYSTCSTGAKSKASGRWDRDAQCGVRSSASLCACQNGLLPFWRPSFMVDGEEVRARPEDCHSLGRRWRGSLQSAVAGRSAVISGDEKSTRRNQAEFQAQISTTEFIWDTLHGNIKWTSSSGELLHKKTAETCFSKDASTLGFSIVNKDWPRRLKDNN